jgi:hypothetical protein
LNLIVFGLNQVIDCLYEIFAHTTDVNESMKVARMVVSVVRHRPAIDLDADYFAETYAAEIVAYVPSTPPNVVTTPVQ